MRIAKCVPQQGIRHIVGRYSVGTPDEVITTKIRKLLRLNIGITAQQERACVRFALAVHAENQRLYNYVMGGR